MKKTRLSHVIMLGTLVLTGCNDDDNNSQATTDEEVRTLATSHGLNGDPVGTKSIASIDEPLAQLGMKLFYSKGLGGDLDSACVSCHHPIMGGGDNLSLPIGVQAEDPDLIGPGRIHSQAKAVAANMEYDGGPTVPRNAPTTFNLGLWEKGLFHDYRVEVLDNGIRTPDSAFGTADSAAHSLSQAQAMFPVTSAEEMRSDFEKDGSNQDLRVALTERFTSQALPNTWLDEFQAAFNSTDDAQTLITYDNIASALAAYQQSQSFVNSPWNNYVKGDNGALSDAAKRGAKLFYSSVEDGGAECVACHSGDFFTDESFHVLAIPQIGRGKGNGEDGSDDFGRARETGQESDRYAFRTPSLLNIEVTGPYGHDGAYDTLADVVRHHLNPEAAIDNFDFTLGALAQGDVQHEHAESNTRLALQQLQKQQADGSSKLKTVNLSEQQIDDLVAFLETLTDPCVKDRECLTPWIPDTTSTGPDGLQLNGYDEAGNLL
ncbi:cytochrome-c peroxidase [Oleiphilus messinensis]|nr:cytochrome c peroxidase [Oleiphilus messinensis]